MATTDPKRKINFTTEVKMVPVLFVTYICDCGTKHVYDITEITSIYFGGYGRVTCTGCRKTITQDLEEIYEQI